MAQQNKQVNNSEKSISEKVEEDFEFGSNNSDEEVDLDQLDKLNLGY